MPRAVNTAEHYFIERPEADTLEGDMSKADLIYVLESLRFRNGLLTIKLDRDARDFLVRALRKD